MFEVPDKEKHFICSNLKAIKMKFHYIRVVSLCNEKRQKYTFTF